MLFIRMLLLRGLWSFWVGNEIGCKMIIIIRNSWFWSCERSLCIIHIGGHVGMVAWRLMRQGMQVGRKVYSYLIHRISRVLSLVHSSPKSSFLFRH